jgi:tRNA pseudouridine38-40 synthase
MLAMPRYRLDLEYEGTRYSGWQVQKDVRTVQGHLLIALTEVLGGAPRDFMGAGRTDSGVHALCQTAHLETTARVHLGRLRQDLNDKLPADIVVLRVSPAKPHFHARHDAIARTYLYQIARRRTAFGKRFVWWIKDSLDVGRMREVAALFPGRRDMRSFTADRAADAETRVHIEAVTLVEAGDLLLVRLQASHFLWKMVRQMVGVLVEAGRGHLSVDDVRQFLQVSTNTPAQWTAPPSGLFLERAWYPGEPVPAPGDAPSPTFQLTHW